MAEFLFVFAKAWRNFSQSFHNHLRVNITMARRQDIVSRGEACDDSDTVNPWRWEWCDKTANDRRLGEFIRRLRKKGVSWCSVCDKELSYASRGLTALTAHVDRAKHNN